ncbi:MULTISPECIES: DUF262 domain-containing protein [Bacillus]|jgi:hypothetical protein|uniref:GmrSD restriction endonuclease domain-containing protein n=1 Tax=Bacillus TaxID=1386 RepID=UPI000BA83ADB|nr:MULTISPECIES: DUF262 domain-containing protein [Bacillus]MCM2583848.1 DUF262 domain-containing protein [Bacillus stercoris]MCY8797930.1 DUF262 domain-containing protein [Bacillus inaquosorum]MEC0769991.1 DUF262 domain-containing protein [Bacillus inaquosorum]MEC0796489.1 DUF262 domain-containing protein [Bacillus inaquosorum]PAO68325.1 hypothetical protein CIK44_12640 [Bacillus sp. X2(2017)]
MLRDQNEDWIEPEELDEQSESGESFEEFDITASPNDFNIKTLFDFIESGVVKIPGFQRNYVWDQNRASKLIESIIIGLPIPQIFLYERLRNKFLVIDGQQRLMSIYYFIKGRFPKKDVRSGLREIFEETGKIPDDILSNNDYFVPFKLKLPEVREGVEHPLNKLTYSTLGEYKPTFDLRTIRNIIIKQNQHDDDSSIFEIFNRLNSGGQNLNTQEIRSSLYYSNFDIMLRNLNQIPRWRQLLGKENPDLRMRDIEILLRGFGILLNGDNYRPSMVKFLNSFAREAKNFDNAKVDYLEKLFKSFLEATCELDTDCFNTKTGKFNISIFEAIFKATCAPYVEDQELVSRTINPDSVKRLKSNSDFINATHHSTARRDIVQKRLSIADNILNGES